MVGFQISEKDQIRAIVKSVYKGPHCVFSRWEIVSKECQKAQHVMVSKCCVAFHYESSTERQTETENRERPALCPSSLWPSARPAPTEEEGEREGVVRACGCVCAQGGGQTFPWQDPRDLAEGRVQPVKERLRARQSISGLHLHNKWSSHGFCRARTHTHHSRVYPLSAHQHTPTQGQRDGEGGRERERKRPAICWSGTLQILTHRLYQKHKQGCGEHRVSKSLPLNTAAVKQTRIPLLISLQVYQSTLWKKGDLHHD